MKKSATSFKFWVGPGALLALVFAMALTVQAHAADSSTPDDECPGAHFCDTDSQDGVEGSLDQEREPVDGFIVRDGDRRGGFRDGRNDGRHGRRGGQDGVCNDPNPYDPRDPDCRRGRPGHGVGREFVTARLSINRPVRFESLEINLMLGGLQQELRGYELSDLQILAADGGVFGPGGRQSELSLVINGRVEDLVHVFNSARHGPGLTAYNLRPHSPVNVGFRGERIQVAVHGDVFVSEILLRFRRIR